MLTWEVYARPSGRAQRGNPAKSPIHVDRLNISAVRGPPRDACSTSAE